CAAERAGLDGRSDVLVAARGWYGHVRFLAPSDHELSHRAGARRGATMSEFLSSLKGDLLDRRMMPVLVALGVALMAALFYALLGGAGGSPRSTTASPGVSPQTRGLAVSQSQTSSPQPVAETTSGAAIQRAGAARDPFAPLPGSTTTTTSATSVTSATSSQ